MRDALQIPDTILHNGKMAMMKGKWIEENAGKIKEIYVIVEGMKEKNIKEMRPSNEPEQQNGRNKKHALIPATIMNAPTPNEVQVNPRPNILPLSAWQKEG